MTAPLEDGYFAIGNFLSPVTSSTTNSLLQDADPVIYNMLEFYENIIRIHMGARWNAEVTKLGRTDLINQTVQSKVPYDPIPWMNENQFKFPLLAAYRKEGTSSWHTTQWYRKYNKINVLWIMPPLSAGQAEALMPFRTVVANILIDRTAMGYDSNYNSGSRIWNISGVDKIGLNADTYGNIPDLSSDKYFPTLMLEGELAERKMPASGNFEPFTGLDGYVIAGTDINNDPDIADFKKDF